MIQALQLLLSLSILVTLHELGHYIAAKAFGCRVEKFYLFIDWNFALFKRKIGETEFGLGWLPIGGYVKIAGFVDESMDTSGVESKPERWELRSKPAWQRLVVMLGGIFVNIILAWIIYSVILFSSGEQFIPNKLLTNGFSFNSAMKELGFVDGDQLVSIDNIDVIEIDPGLSKITNSILFKQKLTDVVVQRSNKRVKITITPESRNEIIKNLSKYEHPFVYPNYKWVIGSFSESSVLKSAGVKEGDRILAINDISTEFFNPSIRKQLMELANQSVFVLVEGSLSNKVDTVYVELDKSGLLGVNVSMNEYIKTRSFSYLSCFSGGLDKTINTINMYCGQLKLMFNPSTGGYKHVGGVISIGKMFPGKWDWQNFWIMTALLSIILAIMNLLPIPALDGGHALIAIVEMVTGKRLPIKILIPLQVAGMIILFALLIYANGMDIIRLFN